MCRQLYISYGGKRPSRENNSTMKQVHDRDANLDAFRGGGISGFCGSGLEKLNRDKHLCDDGTSP